MNGRAPAFFKKRIIRFYLVDNCTFLKSLIHLDPRDISISSTKFHLANVTQAHVPNLKVNYNEIHRFLGELIILIPITELLAFTCIPIRRPDDSFTIDQYLRFCDNI
jgi:hypothetical protein